MQGTERFQALIDSRAQDALGCLAVLENRELSADVAAAMRAPRATARRWRSTAAAASEREDGTGPKRRR
jgi:hypothetical protein